MLGAASLWARPALRGVRNVPLPDGTTIALAIHGDEFLHFTTTADGYTVKRGADGYYYYAVKGADGQLEATSVRATDAQFRKAAELLYLKEQPRMIRPEMTAFQQSLKENAARLYTNDVQQVGGAVKSPRKAGAGRIDYSRFKGLVLLVEFSDRKFLREDAQAFYQELTSKKNMQGYYDASGEQYTKVDGSVRDYFRENSMGMFDPSFDVYGPVQVAMKSDEVGGKNVTESTLANLMKSALSAVNSDVNFADYDLDNNGYVDMVYFIFSGYGSYVQGNNENYIWPHASDLTGWLAKYWNMRYDGKYIGRYACSVEIQDLESMADVHQDLDGIGTMCHEFSHVLGLADHYDSDYDEQGKSDDPGSWDVMAGGADYNKGLTPAGYNAYERYSLGFAPLQTLDVAGTYQLENFGTSNQFYRIPTGTRNEYFFIENRQKVGWDRFLPGHGLLVWRVDSTSSTPWSANTVNANPKHNYFQLVKARTDKSMNSASTPFPGASSVTDLTATTTPSLLSWAGKEAVVDLYDITENEDGLITFDAGKNLYEEVIENFENMAVTNADATDQQGVFCKWDLTKTTIEAVTDGLGNGIKVAKLGRSATMNSSAISKPIKRVSFKVWTGSQQVRISLKTSTDGTNWTAVKNTDGQLQTTLKKNSGETLLAFPDPIAAGTMLQIQMLTTSNSAFAWVDDLKLVYGKGENIDGIHEVTTERASEDRYNLAGQRVTDGHRGIIIVKGKKFVAE